jgi:hypothetical protein
MRRSFAKFTRGATAVFAALLFGATIVVAQANDPFKKETLLNAVRSKRFRTENLVKAVELRGVDFQLTESVAQEFLEAGAFPPLLDAIRANYRPTVAANSPRPNNNGARSPSNSSGNTSASNVPAGPPLSKNEIVTLLQSGVPPARVERIVEARGVDFTLDRETSREITAAGGTRSLLGAISERAASTQANPPNSSEPNLFGNSGGGSARANAPSYDDLMAQAYSKNITPQQSFYLLQQAIQIDSSKPAAYQLLGALLLYGRNDYAGATQAFRAARERGGDAVFRVYHDHDGFFNTYCVGTLYVSKDKVTYEADDGKDSYQARFADIKEAKLNGFVGSQYGAFHLKVTQGDGKPRNYNFAPATQNAAEARLILSFMQGN